MRKTLLMAVAAMMAISASVKATVKIIRVYEGNTVAYEQTYSAVDSVVFLDMPDVPEGAINGVFSVSSTKKVYFSQGNLRATYKNSEWTWSFATNQWDYIGGAVANTSINGNGTVSSNGTVDLFCWSTPASYYGIYNSTSSYASGKFLDWGANQISNGGNVANEWRTLTSDEWSYIISTRTNASNLCGHATVKGVHGFILLPDGTDPVALGFTGSPNNWTDNIYSSENWVAMKNAGAVFMPCAGGRFGTKISNANSEGYYWSSTTDSETVPYAFGIYGDHVIVTECARIGGISVRLVQDVK